MILLFANFLLMLEVDVMGQRCTGVRIIANV